MANFWSIEEEVLLSKLVKTEKSRYDAYYKASKATGRSYDACSNHWLYMLERKARAGKEIMCIRKNAPKFQTTKTQLIVEKFSETNQSVLSLIVSKLSQKSLIELAKELR